MKHKEELNAWEDRFNDEIGRMNLRNYINALILKYRFHFFTDGKGKFKHLNGKSPLQVAQPLHAFGFNFRTDDRISFCRKFKKQPPK